MCLHPEMNFHWRLVILHRKCPDNMECNVEEISFPAWPFEYTANHVKAPSDSLTASSPYTHRGTHLLISLLGLCWQNITAWVLSSRNLVAHSSGDWETQVKVSADSFPRRPPSQMATCSFCPHVALFCARASLASLRPNFFYFDTNQVGLRPIPF